MKWQAAPRLPRSSKPVGRRLLVPEFGDWTLHFDPLQGFFVEDKDGRFHYRLPLDDMLNDLIRTVHRRVRECNHRRLPNNATDEQVLEHIYANSVLQAGPLESKCWIWQRYSNAKNGPVLWIPEAKGQRSVRRWMFTKLRGHPPTSYVKLACGTPNCVNPDHFLDSGAQLGLQERRVLSFLLSRHRPPTYAEISKHLGLAGTTSAAHYVAKLRRKGLVDVPEKGVWRGIRLSPAALALRRA